VVLPGPPDCARTTVGADHVRERRRRHAEVVVTDLADKGKPTQVAFSVPANSVVTKDPRSAGGPGSVTVEWFGGRLLVEEGPTGTRALDLTPCATRTSAHCYFAAGNHAARRASSGSSSTIPTLPTRVVDVTLRTSSGVRRPDALQGLDIPRRSREIIAVHDIAVRQDRVAVSVDAEAGSVVAAQSLVYTTAAGTPGVALSLGSPTTATDWTFAGGVTPPADERVLPTNKQQAIIDKSGQVMRVKEQGAVAV